MSEICTQLIQYNSFVMELRFINDFQIAIVNLD
jgi:hypothetical protein